MSTDFLEKCKRILDIHQSSSSQIFSLYLRFVILQKLSNCRPPKIRKNEREKYKTITKRECSGKDGSYKRLKSGDQRRKNWNIKRNVSVDLNVSLFFLSSFTQNICLSNLHCSCTFSLRLSSDPTHQSFLFVNILHFFH